MDEGFGDSDTPETGARWSDAKPHRGGPPDLRSDSDLHGDSDVGGESDFDDESGFQGEPDLHGESDLSVESAAAHTDDFEGDDDYASPDESAAPRETPDAHRAPSRARRPAPARRHGSGSRGGEVEGERLQKVLSRAGLASRREAEDWIRAGRITINGAPAVLGSRVLPSDQLRLDSRLIRQRETGGGSTAFIVHRSPGESLTQPNMEAQPEGADAPGAALIERLPTRAGRRFITISPMPRVDGGLELVTSDGELGVKLQRSVRNLVSQFSVRVLGELSAEQIENILGGNLDSGEHVNVVSCESSGGEGANRWYTLVARGASGKDVRQLFERQGAVLSRIQRTHLGAITMERGLGRGQFRELTPEELEALLAPPAEG